MVLNISHDPDRIVAFRQLLRLEVRNTEKVIYNIYWGVLAWLDTFQTFQNNFFPFKTDMIVFVFVFVFVNLKICKFAPRVNYIYLQNYEL